MKRGKQSARFVATNMLFLLLAVLLIGGSLALALVEQYPPADSLVYEECTFERYERISWVKYGASYFIYVEEYGKPLEIDSISIRAIDLDALEAVKVGDSIVVSKEEGKKSFCLYALSHGDKDILAYEDFLATQNGDNSVGAVFTGVMSLLPIGLFIANVILYKKTGVCLYLYVRGYYRPR